MSHQSERVHLILNDLLKSLSKAIIASEKELGNGEGVQTVYNFLQQYFDMLSSEKHNAN